MAAQYALFKLGRLAITPAAFNVLCANGKTPSDLLERHRVGDWGDVCKEDYDANMLALEDGSRLLSVYNLPNGDTVWIITEADRSSTTILLPSDY